MYVYIYARMYVCMYVVLSRATFLSDIYFIRKCVCLFCSNVSGQPLLQLSLNSSTPFVMPSLLQDIAKMKLPKTEPSEPLQVSSNDSNKDALKEIRDEIVSTIERIAQVSLTYSLCEYHKVNCKL
jgi:hypothetical protein